MVNALPFLCLNGKIVSTHNVVIPAINSGMLFGEGVFTTLKVRQSVPLFLEKHQERLRESLQELTYPMPTELTNLENDICLLVTKLAVSECGIRITVFYDPEKPIAIIHAFPFPEQNIEIKLKTISDARDAFRHLKTTNRLINQQALAKAKEEGFDDAVFVEGKKFIEATTASIFSINRDGTLITPYVKNIGLESITKQILKEQTEVIETNITEDTEGPLVLVSSLRTRSVLSLNGRKLRDAGKIQQRILQLRGTAEDEYIQKHIQ